MYCWSVSVFPLIQSRRLPFTSSSGVTRLFYSVSKSRLLLSHSRVVCQRWKFQVTSSSNYIFMWFVHYSPNLFVASVSSRRVIFCVKGGQEIDFVSRIRATNVRDLKGKHIHFWESNTSDGSVVAKLNMGLTGFYFRISRTFAYRP